MKYHQSSRRRKGVASVVGLPEQQTNPNTDLMPLVGEVVVFMMSPLRSSCPVDLSSSQFSSKPRREWG